MDRGARRILEAAVDSLAAGTPAGQSRVYFDLIGPAVYQTEPAWRTAVLCLRCAHVGLIISIPRKPRLTWTCSQCGWVAPLEPPRAVLDTPDPRHPNPRLAARRVS